MGRALWQQSFEQLSSDELVARLMAVYDVLVELTDAPGPAVSFASRVLDALGGHDG